MPHSHNSIFQPNLQFIPIQISHSLTSLKISHGLSNSLTAFPVAAFRQLISLRELDLSNNHLSQISDTSFHFLSNLRTLELNDNAINDIQKGTFQGDHHERLENILLNFNNLKSIQQHTFVDLKVSAVYERENRSYRWHRKLKHAVVHFALVIRHLVNFN